MLHVYLADVQFLSCALVFDERQLFRCVGQAFLRVEDPGPEVHRLAVAVALDQAGVMTRGL